MNLCVHSPVLHATRRRMFGVCVSVWSYVYTSVWLCVFFNFKICSGRVNFRLTGFRWVSSWRNADGEPTEQLRTSFLDQVVRQEVASSSYAHREATDTVSDNGQLTQLNEQSAASQWEDSHASTDEARADDASDAPNASDAPASLKSRRRIIGSGLTRSPMPIVVWVTRVGDLFQCLECPRQAVPRVAEGWRSTHQDRRIQRLPPKMFRFQSTPQ